MKREMTCIICPRGCQMTVTQEENGLRVCGNACPRGEEYAINECTNPLRTVTATVRVSNRKDTMLSVKTEKPVPKKEMMAVMALLRNTQVEAPVTMGKVIIPNVWGTNIIATQKVD